MKGFEILVLQHIKDNLPDSLDPLHYAIRTNRFREDPLPSMQSSHTILIKSSVKLVCVD